MLLLGLLGVPEKGIAVSPSSIQVNVAPENPAPGESVRITLASYASNLDSVSISWSVDGKAMASGIGVKSFDTKAPPAGEETRVSATVALPDGSIEKVILIRPITMALLWQANDSYVPPFYKGKALPTPDSEVKIVALPETKSGVTDQNMVYAWQKDYTNDPGGSGYGKNFYIYHNDYLDDSNTIGVTVATTDQKYSSQASLTLGTFQPDIIFYKNDPSLGTIWEHALENDHTVTGEEIIQAAPYYISPSEIRAPSLVWDWSINGSYVATSGVGRNFFPVKAQPGMSGVASIGLEINNTYKLFESATKELRVQF